jgi:hypothetical protein
VIESAYVTYVRFANFGKEPIRSADIAPANPLRIDVAMPKGDDGGDVLDNTLEAASREVIGLRVGNVITFKKLTRAKLEFDFLDLHDGGVVRILSSGRPDSVSMTGDIIGMPTGIMRSDTSRLPRGCGASWGWRCGSWVRRARSCSRLSSSDGGRMGSRPVRWRSVTVSRGPTRRAGRAEGSGDEHQSQ